MSSTIPLQKCKVRRTGSGSLGGGARGSGAGASGRGGGAEKDTEEVGALSGKCLAFLANAKTLLTQCQEHMNLFGKDDGVKVAIVDKLTPQT